MNNNTLPKPPAQHGVDEATSITKRSSENDRDSTLPTPAGKPSSNLRQEGFPDGSVMWCVFHRKMELALAKHRPSM